MVNFQCALPEEHNVHYVHWQILIWAVKYNSLKSQQSHEIINRIL
jgi:hypothetical protein